MSDKNQKPNIVKSSRLFGDYLIMLIAPVLVSLFYYGERVLLILAVSILSAVICEFAMSVMLKKTYYLKDLSGIYAAAAIALMMPAGIPLYVPATAAVFATAVVKVPFGTKTPFSPAAAGFAFVCICFKEQIFDFAQKSENKLLGGVSIGSMLANGNSIHIDAANITDIIGGNVAGPIGTGCGILMLGCCAYLFVRRKRALLATAGFVAACIVFAAVFPRINASALTSIVLELSAGSLMFAAVFLITDPYMLPKKSIVRFIYGAVCGITCMIMRYAGAFEEPVCFAVLLANGLRPVTESFLERKSARAASEGKEAAVNG